MAKSDKLNWQKIKTYLLTMEMKSSVDIERVRELFSCGQLMCPEKIRAIFISNYTESEGKKQYKDLWLFSDNYVLEVLNFARQETPKVEMTMFTDNLLYISVEVKNYHFAGKAQKDSTLHVFVTMLTRFECDFLATGQNCDILYSIFEKYLKNNITRGQSSGIL